MNKKLISVFLIAFFAGTLLGQNVPVEGDDLVNCLGQPTSSELATRLNNFIGNKDAKEEISFLNYGKGIQVNIEESMVTSIDLYNGSNPYSSEFKKFPGKLPLDIDFDLSIFKTKKKMGDGFEQVGDMEATIQLIKVFRLNENDDYRMTVEFNVGRMIMMSLVYIEGGADDGDSLGTQSSGEAGFRGNDFFTMMKKNKYNLEFSRLCTMLGLPTFENRSRKLYAEGGVDVEFKNGGIQKITLYSGGQRCDYKDMTFQSYLFDLPYGLRMENTKSATIKKLGTPASTSGNVITYNVSHTDFSIAFKGEKIDYVKFQLAEMNDAAK